MCINQVHVKISINFSRLNFRADWNFVIDQHELYKNFWTSVSRNFYCRAGIRTLLFQTIKLEKLTQRMHRSSKALKIRLKGFTQKSLKFEFFYGRFYCLRGTYCGISCANKISDSQHTGKYFSPYLFFSGCLNALKPKNPWKAIYTTHQSFSRIKMTRFYCLDWNPSKIKIWNFS